MPFVALPPIDQTLLSRVAFAILGFCWNASTRRLGRLGGLHRGAQGIAQASNGARVKLRHSRLVDANLGANLLHRRFAVIVEADDLLLAQGQRRDRRLHAVLRFVALVGHVGLLGFRGDQRGRHRGFVVILGSRQRGGRLDGVDANDGAAQALLVGAHLRRKIGERRLAAEFATKLLTCALELAPLAADAARPCILAQRVDHRAANAPLGKGLELDATRLIEPVRCVDESDHAVLNQIADIDRVRHGGRDATGELFDERKAGYDAGVLFACLGAHLRDLRRSLRAIGLPTAEIHRRALSPKQGREAQVDYFSDICGKLWVVGAEPGMASKEPNSPLFWRFECF